MVYKTPSLHPFPKEHHNSTINEAFASALVMRRTDFLHKTDRFNQIAKDEFLELH
jgi:hypothetical protein